MVKREGKREVEGGGKKEIKRKKRKRDRDSPVNCRRSREKGDDLLDNDCMIVHVPNNKTYHQSLGLSLSHDINVNSISIMQTEKCNYYCMVVSVSSVVSLL